MNEYDTERNIVLEKIIFEVLEGFLEAKDNIIKITFSEIFILYKFITGRSQTSSQNILRANF